MIQGIKVYNITATNSLTNYKNKQARFCACYFLRVICEKDTKLKADELSKKWMTFYPQGFILMKYILIC